MSIISKRDGSQISGEMHFKLWYELGSLPKVANHLRSIGELNPYTRKPYTTLNIHRSAYIWVLENPNEAREYYKKVKAIWAFNDDEWNKWLIRRAKLIYATSKNRFLDWIKRMGFERYKDLYAEQFGLV